MNLENIITEWKKTKNGLTSKQKEIADRHDKLQSRGWKTLKQNSKYKKKIKENEKTV